jgi:predicted DNA-binding protein
MKFAHVHLMVTEEQLGKLKRLSAKTGAPINVLIRRAIDAYLKKAK